MICESTIKRLAVQCNIDGDDTTQCDAIAFARAIEKASRLAALDEAAKACEAMESRISEAMLKASEQNGTPIDGGYLNACDDCADAIRAISGPIAT